MTDQPHTRQELYDRIRSTTNIVSCWRSHLLTARVQIAKYSIAQCYNQELRNCHRRWKVTLRPTDVDRTF